MINILEVDFENSAHCIALVELMNHYMQDKMGDHPPHTEESAHRLISGLRNHCNKLCLFAKKDGEYIGLVNCFISYGTFAAKPFINVHDVVVKDDYRGKGVGRKLLEKVTEAAKEMDCAKITLEVREDNTGAKYLYKNLGYQEDTPPMHFWTKHL